MFLSSEIIPSGSNNKGLGCITGYQMIPLFMHLLFNQQILKYMLCVEDSAGPGYTLAKELLPAFINFVIRKEET